MLVADIATPALAGCGPRAPRARIVFWCSCTCFVLRMRWKFVADLHGTAIARCRLSAPVRIGHGVDKICTELLVGLFDL